MLRECIGKFRQFNDMRSAAMGLHQLGVVLESAGWHAEARECWEEAFEVLEPLDDPSVAERWRLLDAE